MSLRTRVRSLAASRPLLTAAVVGSLFAAAGFGAAITVSESNFAGMFGTIATVSEDLTVTGTSVEVVKASASASGTTQGAAAELGTGASGQANTALTRANWAYVVTLEESAIDSILSGTYKVELFMDEVSQGALYVKQDTSNANALEGAKLRWDIGSNLPTGDTAFRVAVTLP